MYTSYYGMTCNPFLKEESIKYKYESNDYKETISRFNYLMELRGIGVFTGVSGYGKTYIIRCFVESIHPDEYKIIYISASKELNEFNLYKEITDKLGLDIGACYKIDTYNNIQKEIRRLYEEEKVKPLIIIDDAHNLTRGALLSLKVLYDFEMDSKDYVILILVGQNELKEELKKGIYESLRQRIIINYVFNGLDRDEVKEYIETRLEKANTTKKLFEPEAISALYSSSKSSPRKLNTLITNCLMLGFQKQINTIDTETVMEAKEEMDLK